jgi:hypothetical protein
MIFLDFSFFEIKKLIFLDIVMSCHDSEMQLLKVNAANIDRKMNKLDVYS